MVFLYLGTVARKTESHNSINQWLKNDLGIDISNNNENKDTVEEIKETQKQMKKRN